jgi:hypothetical protein
MKKIPTLYRRDPDDMKRVLREVTPGCEWVLADEGIPTRKYDGTCVLIRRDGLAIHAFARREVKPGKEPPPNFIEADHDEATGKTMGWEPAEQSSFAKLIAEAIADNDHETLELVPGTYELCGPKVNGNPEGYGHHVLIPHFEADHLHLGFDMADPHAFDLVRDWLLSQHHEGIVWHHPDGRMAKLKRRDFGRG